MSTVVDGEAPVEEFLAQTGDAGGGLLVEIAREGARRMLAAALEAEVAD